MIVFHNLLNNSIYFNQGFSILLVLTVITGNQYQIQSHNLNICNVNYYFELIINQYYHSQIQYRNQVIRVYN